MDLFSLVAKLTLDTNEFEKDLDRAEDQLNDVDVAETKLELDNDEFNSALEESQGLGDQFGTEMEGVFKGIKTALEVTGIVALISGIVNGLKEAINMTAETADGIDKGSKQLGISRKAYQEWDHALRQSGSSIQDVKKGIINFQAAIKAADPKTMFADADDAVDGLADKTAGLSAEAYEAMRDLGLLDRLQAGEFQNAEQLMEASLLALASYEGSSDDRGILVRKLFGRGGDQLNALLDEGEAGVKALLSEASDLGLIMSDEEINNAVAYGDAVANLNAELDAIKQAFVADIIPVLTDAVKWLTDFLTQLNPRLQTNSVFQLFDDINKRTLAASRDIDDATLKAKALIKDLQDMGDYWSLDEEGRMTWDALAAKALELFPQLSDYIDTDGKKIKGNTKDIEDNIDAWARLEKQRLLSAAMAEKQEAVAKQLTAAYEKGAEAREKEIEADIKKGDAIKELNKYLAEGSELSEDATFAEFQEARSSILAGLDPEKDLQLFNEISRIGSDWSTVQVQAEGLRNESEKMKSEAIKAQESLASEEKYLSEEMGLTQQSVIKEKKLIEDLIKTINKVPEDKTTTFHTEYDDRGYDHSYAIGSPYIPYDQMAMLHRGERVLTATENRRGEGSGIDYGHLEDRIAAAIRTGMNGATVRSYLNGREITEEVNRENMRGVKGRRFAT